MHDLVVPLADAGRGIKAHERLREHVRAGTAAAEEIVARRAEGQIDEPAPGVERERRPDVRMSGVAPRVVAPGVVAEFTRLRDWTERPDLLARARIERANVARRIVSVHEAIADAVAENDQVLVDDRRRRVGVMRLVDLPHETAAHVDDAARPETLDRAPGGGVQTDQPIPAVHEDAKLVAGGAVPPRGDAAVHEAGAVRRLA